MCNRRTGNRTARAMTPLGASFCIDGQNRALSECLKVLVFVVRQSRKEEKWLAKTEPMPTE